MATGILQPDTVPDLPMDARLLINQIGQTGIQDRRHAVFEGGTVVGFVALLAVEVEVLPKKVTDLFFTS